MHSTVNAPRSLIPIGAAALLPDTAEHVRRLEEVLLGRIGQWGYREIIPPTFEYLDVLSAGLAPPVLEKCFKFADWTTGRILVLRPDVTAQIARIVAMGMGGAELPLRFCYRSTVFRYEPEHVGRDREIFQIGVELIGVDGPHFDAELLLLLVELMKAAGLPDFTVSLGHVGFYQRLLVQSGLSPEKRREAEYAAAHKDLPRLEQVLAQERVSRRLARTLLETLERCGRDDVLEWGRRIAGRDPALREPLDRLASVYRFLIKAGCGNHVVLDLGEFRGFDYYDGVVFDVFTDTVGRELGGGGRYNHLIGRFGRDLPSTGFAVDIDRLFAAMRPGDGSQKTARLPVVVLSAPRQYQAAWKLAQRLRASGWTVVQDTVLSAEALQIRHLRKQRRYISASAIVMLGADGLSKTEAFVALPGQSFRASKVQQGDLPSVLHTSVLSEGADGRAPGSRPS